MGTTRMPIRKMYEACKENCSGYGTCKRGFENWYSRRTKDNGCPLVRRQRTTCKRLFPLRDTHGQQQYSL